MAHALDKSGKTPTQDALNGALDFIARVTGVCIPLQDFSRILALYPYANAKLSDHGWGDTELRDIVLDVVSHAFLGSTWPAFDDDAETKAFIERLRFANGEYEKKKRRDSGGDANF